MGKNYFEQRAEAAEKNAERRRKIEAEGDPSKLAEFDRNVYVAEQIANVMLAVDLALFPAVSGSEEKAVSSEELSTLLGTMEENNSTLAALPFPRTLNEADKRERDLKVLRALVSLVRAREEWHRDKGRKDFAEDDEVARIFGLDT